MASKNARNNVTAPFIGVSIVLLAIVVSWLLSRFVFDRLKSVARTSPQSIHHTTR